MIQDPKLRQYLKYISLGGEIAIGLSAPIFLGYWLDIWFKSSPWLLLAGIATGILLMVRIAVQLIQSTGDQEK